MTNMVKRITLIIGKILLIPLFLIIVLLLFAIVFILIGAQFSKHTSQILYDYMFIPAWSLFMYFNNHQFSFIVVLIISISGILISIISNLLPEDKK